MPPRRSTAAATPASRSAWPRCGEQRCCTTSSTGRSRCTAPSASPPTCPSSACTERRATRGSTTAPTRSTGTRSPGGSCAGSRRLRGCAPEREAVRHPPGSRGGTAPVSTGPGLDDGQEWPMTRVGAGSDLDGERGDGIVLDEWAGLDGKVAVITGGAGGLGRAVTVDLVRAGVAVAVCDRDQGALDVLRGLLADIGAPDPLLVCFDVRETEALTAFFEQVDQRFRRVDILVNIPGGGYRAKVIDMSPKGTMA